MASAEKTRFLHKIDNYSINQQLIHGKSQIVKLFHVIHLILLIFLFGHAQAVPFQTFSGLVAGNAYKVPLINGDVIKVSISTFPVLPTAQIIVSLAKESIASFPATLNPILYNPILYNPNVFSTSAISGTLFLTNHFVLINFGGANNNIIEYQIKIEVNSAMYYFGNNIGSTTKGAVVHKFTINNACKFNLKTDIPSTYMASTVKIFFPNKTQSTTSGVILTSFDQNTTVTSSLGTWFVVVIPGALATQVPYTIAIKTFCDSLCLNQDNYFYQTSCNKNCGDGIRTIGESCDNGNKLGCSSNCVVDLNYVCYGSIGSTSYCRKDPICGDNIVDDSEECDNGNKTGCTNQCKPDASYKCTKDKGKASICQSCGGNIVVGDELCDNANQIGCSKNCRVDPGFECWGSPSICWRKDPLCGNGVIEIGESCDDGNIINGDGCSKGCMVQPLFTCTGKFGENSSCSKNVLVAFACGNQLFQPFPNSAGFMQQCDNGNKTGCINCTVDSRWTCLSTPGRKSDCYQIYIPLCGNGKLDAMQSCDDGNINNGDGCNSFCKKQRIGPEPPLARSGFCGDFIVQIPWEQCDLGFPIFPSFGCGFNCQIINGFQCPPPGTNCFRI